MAQPTVHLKDSHLGGMGLAKVGNQQRQESLQVSKQLCHFDEDEAELLTLCFLKSFRSLELHQFADPEELAKNVVYAHAQAIFASTDELLKRSAKIAEHLYDRSQHPNIKSGDLCVGLLNNIVVNDEVVQGLCIIKSESKVPFLQISIVDDDLRLVTQQGIYPDKIDKGCLIINHQADDGYLVYVFDKGGGATHFWINDFLDVAPADDDDYHTRRYAEMCVAFAEKGLPEDVGAEARVEIANSAFDYIDDNEQFDLEDFKKTAFKDTDVREQFSEFKESFEEEHGQPLNDKFMVVKEAAEKAKKKLKARLKLDTGAEIRFTSGFVKCSDQFLERGFDEDKHMSFVKIYFHQEK
ncbi:MAG: hypothetical protein ACI8T1_004590 [Verrucomicrobiales bacterium]|jgi:hypothetical protein